MLLIQQFYWRRLNQEKFLVFLFLYEEIQNQENKIAFPYIYWKSINHEKILLFPTFLCEHMLSQVKILLISWFAVLGKYGENVPFYLFLWKMAILETILHIILSVIKLLNLE